DVVARVHARDLTAPRPQPIKRRAAVKRGGLDLLRVVDAQHARQHVDLATPRAVQREYRVVVELDHALVDARLRAPVIGPAFEADSLAAPPPGELVRPGA